MDIKRRTLKEIREDHGLSLAKAAAEMGLTTPALWQWEGKEPEWFKQRQRNLLLRVYTPEEVAEALDSDWTPAEPEPTPEPTPAVNPLLLESRYSGAEFSHMIRELTEVFIELSDDGKAQLIDYADFLYHRENGMSLPRITRATEEVPDDVWEEIEKIRQTPVTQG